MGHHHHHHTASNLKVAFFLNLGFTIIEIVGGVLVNSVAIISDAIHDLGDSLSLGTAWYLERKSTKKADDRYTFGYRRLSLLGALVNGLVLVGGSIFVVLEAIERIQAPETPDATGMIGFAILGIVVNGYAAWKLSGGKTLNEKVITWHLLEDVLGWSAILIAAIILYFWEIPLLDPLLSLGITLYIMLGVVRRLKETVFLFLQGVPRDVNISEIEDALVAIPKVGSTHHTHVWSLDGEHHVFTTHLKLQDPITCEEILDVKKHAKQVLSKYPFQHYTLETEFEKEVCGLNQDAP